MYKNGSYIGIIYKISNDVNNKLYIGQTTRTLEQRWSDHKSSSKRYHSSSMIIYNAMRKYGAKHFHIATLQEVFASTQQELRQKLNDLEIYYIHTLNTLKPNGYNCTSGGDAVSSQCEKPVDQYSLNGEFINSFPSITRATEIVGAGRNIGNIYSCCSGETKTAWGYVWRYQGDAYDKYSHTHNGDRSVSQYTKEGIFIANHPTLADAARSVGKFLPSGKPASAHIHSCCKGALPSAYGYVWRYQDDPFDKYPCSKKHFSRRVNMYDDNDCFIRQFDSVSAVTTFLNVADSTVIHCCKHRCGTYFCKGYKLYYANDPDQPNKSMIVA